MAVRKSSRLIGRMAGSSRTSSALVTRAVLTPAASSSSWPGTWNAGPPTVAIPSSHFEAKYYPAPDYAATVCPDCRTELLEQPKEFLVDMLGRVAGVNVITIASLALHSPDSPDTLGLWNAPKREGFTRRPVTMKEFIRKYRRVQ
jgi:hypothetical protein